MTWWMHPDAAERAHERASTERTIADGAALAARALDAAGDDVGRALVWLNVWRSAPDAYEEQLKGIANETLYEWASPLERATHWNPHHTPRTP